MLSYLKRENDQPANSNMGARQGRMKPSEPQHAPGERHFEWIAVALIFVSITLLTAHKQKPITYRDGKGWDGADYYAMARNFAEGRPPAAGLPFINRIAGPFLASRINPRDLMASFRMLDLAAAAITLVLFVSWLRLHLWNWRIRVLMILLYAAEFHTPVRFLHFYPATPDSLTHMGVLAAMLTLHYVEYAPSAVAALCMSCFAIAAVPIREMMLMFTLALLFSRNLVSIDRGKPWLFRLRDRPSLWLFVPMLAGGLVFYVIRHWVITLDDTGRGLWGIGPPNGYAFPNIIVDMVYNKGPVPYFLAWFITYGPVLTLLVWKWRDCVVYLWGRQVQLAVFVGISLLGWLAGTDSERYLIWDFPIVYIMLGRVIESNLWLFRLPFLTSALTLTQAVSARIFAVLPDYPPKPGHTWVVLTMWGAHVSLLDLFSYNAKQGLATLSFLEYVAVSLVLLLWLRFVQFQRHGTKWAADFVPRDAIDAAAQCGSD